ncbi:DinB family protein [Lentibacillus sp. N15]|uniref:DinB family protein n=1 Tax=Lentibacillus songyuanensis TaxID=3136161 RepID=UPI0031BA4425
MKHRVLQLYDYHIWANNKFIARLKELPNSVYTQEIESVFPSIAETLAHIYIVDSVWLGVMREDPFDKVQEVSVQATQNSKGKTIDEMEALFEELTEQYEAFFSSLEDMDKPMAPEHPAFGRLETYLSELVQHVVNHGTYHRGNITAMIRQQGHASISTDYIMYLYDRQAAN